MSELVERLRNPEHWEVGRIMLEAADTIERQCKEIELLRQDNHSLWGSLRNRMAADATRTLPR